MKFPLLRYDLICLILFSSGIVLTDPRELQSADSLDVQNDQLGHSGAQKIKIINLILLFLIQDGQQMVKFQLKIHILL